MALKSNLKNVLSLFSMELFSRLIGFLAVTYLARVLGNEGFGLVNIGQAVLTYVVIAGTGGLNLYGTRKVVSGDESIEEITGKVIVIKLILTLLFFLAVLLVCYFTTSANVFYIIIAYCLFALPSVFLLEWYFQGIMKMEQISTGRILGMAAYYLSLLLLVNNAGDAVYSGIAWTLGGIVNAVYLLLIFKNYGFSLRFAKNYSVASILSETKSLGVSSVISQVVAMFPVIFLGIASGASETGLYSAAYKVVVLLLVLDRVFSALFFPKITAYFKNSLNEFNRMFNLVLKIIVVTGLSVSLLAIIGAKPLMTLFFGNDFAAASVTFSILTGVFYLSLINSAFTFTLIAMNKERYFTQSLIYGVIVFFISVFILIYYLGAPGAAIAYILFQVTSLIVMMVKVNRVIEYQLMRTLVIPTVLSLVILVTILNMIHLNVAVNIIIAAAVAIPLISLAAGIGIKEIRTIKRAFI